MLSVYTFPVSISRKISDIYSIVVLKELMRIILYNVLIIMRLITVVYPQIILLY